jgi:hypothetical protein
MKISSLFISVLLFGLIMTGIGTFYNSFQNSYDINGTDLGTFSAYDSLNQSAGDMSSSIKTGETVETSALTYIDGIVTTLKSLIDLPSTINTLINKVGIEIGISSIVISTIKTIIIVLVGFGIAAIFMRNEI